MKKCFICSVGIDDKGNFIVYNIFECNPNNASNKLFCYAGNHAFIVYDKIGVLKNRINEYIKIKELRSYYDLFICCSNGCNIWLY